MELSKYFIDYRYSLNNLYVTDKSLALIISVFKCILRINGIASHTCNYILYCNIHVSTNNVNTVYSMIITANQVLNDLIF